jgi:hypothetical protein
MEVSDQFHALAVLPPGKAPSIETREEVGLAPEPVRRQWKKENILSCRESNPDTSDVHAVAHSLSHLGSVKCIINKDYETNFIFM